MTDLPESYTDFPLRVRSDLAQSGSNIMIFIEQTQYESKKFEMSRFTVYIRKTAAWLGFTATYKTEGTAKL